VSSPIADQVLRLAEPICRDVGVELFDVDYGGGVVRVFVERAGGVDIDTIALITRELSRALDHADPIPGRYTLEVSSPGLERTLRRPVHFEKALGELVNVKTQPYVEGDRRLRGQLLAADSDGIEIDVAGTRRRVAYDDIERATTVFEWGPAPKPGKGVSKNASTKAVNA
jgi:ribosome maturation factor RimP